MMTTEPKFTSGDWNITYAIIGSVEPAYHPSAIVAASSGSADTICDFNWMSRRPLAEQVANARLIASAPAMYEALETIAALEDPKSGDRGSIRRARHIAKATLSLARGEG